MGKMRSRFGGFSWVALTSLASMACGGDDHPGNLPSGSGGTGAGGSGGIAGAAGSTSGGGGSGGTSGDGGVTGGTGGTGAVNQPGSPKVTVTSPTAATNPSSDTVVVGDQVDVLCTAEKSPLATAKPVDPTTVKIAVLDSKQAVVAEFPGTATKNANEYTSSFVLTTLPNGPMSVRCTAADTSKPAKTGLHSISTFVDHGPDISVVTPLEGSSYPLAGAVPFEFKVTPAPLATGDTEAGVASVGLKVNGVTIPATPDPLVTNGYKVAVDFNDKSLFPQTPAGSLPVVIEGINNRTPAAAKRTKNYNFSVDGQGPVITIKSPKNQDIIGGKVTLSFSVVDPLSGVDQKTINVELNQAANYYTTGTAWTNNKDDYTFQFDSATVVGSKVQMTVNITASDKAGNKSAGASVLLYLDNEPPWVDLDPSNVRTRKKVGAAFQCSDSFDPLGTWAANDLQIVTGFKHFRALVFERTNYVSGQTVLYYATTDPKSVYLYLQPDAPTIPLLINNDSDPECDALNTIVGGQTIPSLQLNPVTPAGNARYSSTDPSTAPTTAGADPVCAFGNDPVPTTTLCTNSSDMTVVIKHTMSGTEPVVYGIGQMTGLECTGTGWELSSQLANATQKEGWFCLAAIGKDKVGNTQISPPLRICYDDPATTAHPACAVSSTTPPTCTDGCTAPPRFPATLFPAPP